ncbi:tetratricopeptide repeat protein [Mechercharimyces sp. CAU 1602]|uniref:tetratricopeptide repeat protein n=1 Tax=Mechercharimyces sp. CAU 1602 TaxID=2973933 RepID=UPI0021617AC0|nr:tetratricopeptide repeat protein [Mechercharimyces sp. CAU 1602]MCS1350663.1 tetratricopeptide repeat protein [Mechercharimyces sp. CAU 1602]
MSSYLDRLKRQLPSLQALTTFTEDLREVPLDQNQIERAILQAEVECAGEKVEEDKEAALFLCGYLGNAYRVVGDVARALNYLKQALGLAEELDNVRQLIVALLRLGEAYKYAGDLKQAEALFIKAQTKATTHDVTPYIDFCLQHLGKCLWEQGRGTEAKALLTEALRLRNMKGDRDLIASTQLALNVVNRHTTRLEKHN